MVYIRGHRLDYERWNHLGNEAWGYEEILPYFIKSEDKCVAKVEEGKYNVKLASAYYATVGFADRAWRHSPAIGGLHARPQNAQSRLAVG